MAYVGVACVVMAYAVIAYVVMAYAGSKAFVWCMHVTNTACVVHFLPPCMRGSFSAVYEGIFFPPCMRGSFFRRAKCLMKGA